MFKKFQRCIVKSVLEKKLVQELRELNLLQNKQVRLIVEEETEFYICFNFEIIGTRKKQFEKIYFKDYGKDEAEITVIIKTTENFESITFSVSKTLSLVPKTYTISIEERGKEWIQKIDINSGKITLSTVIIEKQNENFENTFNTCMSEIAKMIFERTSIKTTITASDFGEKIYWINQELSEVIAKPESAVKLKQFYNSY